MKYRNALAFLLTIIVIGSSGFTTDLNRWELLGKRTVKHTIDRDEIAVTARDGRFTAIKLAVDKAPVRFRSVVVHYRNGQTQALNMRNLIAPGGETRAINLNGRKRIIRKVVFYYDTQHLGGKRARVRLYGLR